MMEKAGDLVSKAMAASLEQVRPGVTEMDMDQFGNALIMEETPRLYPVPRWTSS